MPKLLTVGIHKITSKSHIQSFQVFLYDSEDNQQLFQYSWTENECERKSFSIDLMTLKIWSKSTIFGKHFYGIDEWIN